MVEIASIIKRLSSFKALVIGDLMLDSYTIGKARRISPEAPVPVVRVESEEERAGGSGNVVLNLLSLGAKVEVVGRIGKDVHGQTLKGILHQEGASVEGIIEEKGYQTPLKNRVIADNQQIVRVDHETVQQLSAKTEKNFIDLLPNLLKKVDVVAVSDYGKGMLTKSLLQALIKLANELNIPVIIDPKGVDFSKYTGATVIKPNFSEAIAASGLESDSTLDEIGHRLLEITQVKHLMITRSQEGISTFTKNEKRQDFPVKIRKLKDVTGAGDTVLATLTVAIANGMTIAEAAQLSNLAAGIAIEQLGCARVSIPELARRMISHYSSSKIFTSEQLDAVKEALRGQDIHVLSVDSREGFGSDLIIQINQLAKEKELIVCVTDLSPSQKFVNAIASLEAVSFVCVGGTHSMSPGKR